jgi:hypothetical protein
MPKNTPTANEFFIALRRMGNKTGIEPPGVHLPQSMPLCNSDISELHILLDAETGGLHTAPCTVAASNIKK